MPNTKPSLQKIADELAIRNVLGTYCRAIDRLDLAMLKTVYHPDGIDDHGVFAGNAHEFADMIIKRMGASTEYGFHTVSHSTIEVKGNFAMAETYYSGYHRIAGGKAAADFMGPGYAAARAKEGTLGHDHEYTCGGRYIDLFEKRSGVWRILHRRITNEWGRTAPTMIDWTAGEVRHFNLPGKRDRSDPYYDLLARFEKLNQPKAKAKAKAKVKVKPKPKVRASAKKAVTVKTTRRVAVVRKARTPARKTTPRR